MFVRMQYQVVCLSIVFEFSCMTEGLMTCAAAGSPDARSPFAATLATALATASNENPQAAAQLIAAASSREVLIMLYDVHDLDVQAGCPGAACAALLKRSMPMAMLLVLFG
jgi:hypothetical protein